MKEIIGHHNIVSLFESLVDKKKISHAYCFAGMEKLGKKVVAENIACRLLKVESKKLRTCADFCLVRQMRDEKSGKKKKDIDIKQIRELSRMLSRHSFLGGRKVAIIDQAEKMNANSANALLKILEEPPANTVIFLITADQSKLPQTINSRVQTVYFNPVETDIIFKYLLSQGSPEDEAAEMASLCLGKPGRAIGWLRCVPNYQYYKREVERFSRLFGQPFYKKLELVDDMFGDKMDHISARNRLLRVMDIWQTIMRDKLLKQLNMGEYAVHKKTSGEHQVRIDFFDQIAEAKELLRKNIHPRLLIEKILIKIP